MSRPHSHRLLRAPGKRLTAGLQRPACHVMRSGSARDAQSGGACRKWELARAYLSETELQLRTRIARTMGWLSTRDAGQRVHGCILAVAHLLATRHLRQRGLATKHSKRLSRADKSELDASSRRSIRRQDTSERSPLRSELPDRVTSRASLKSPVMRPSASDRKIQMMVYNICKVRKGIEISSVRPVLSKKNSLISECSRLSKKAAELAEAGQEPKNSQVLSPQSRPRSMTSEITEACNEDRSRLAPANQASRSRRANAAQLLSLRHCGLQQAQTALPAKASTTQLVPDLLVHRSAVLSRHERLLSKKSRYLKFPQVRLSTVCVDQKPDSTPKATNSSVKKECSTQETHKQEWPATVPQHISSFERKSSEPIAAARKLTLRQLVSRGVVSDVSVRPARREWMTARYAGLT